MPKSEDLVQREVDADTSVSIAKSMLDGEMEQPLLACLRMLTESELACLWAKLEAIDSVNAVAMTDVAIAERAGVDYKTLWSAKRNPVFQEALSLACTASIRGDMELGVRALKGRVKEGNMPAIRMYLELGNIYQQVSRVESVNVNIELDASGKMPTQIRLELVERWHELGWTIEDFVTAWKQAGF